MCKFRNEEGVRGWHLFSVSVTPFSTSAGKFESLNRNIYQLTGAVLVSVARLSHKRKLPANVLEDRLSGELPKGFYKLFGR